MGVEISQNERQSETTKLLQVGATDMAQRVAKQLANKVETRKLFRPLVMTKGRFFIRRNI